MIKLDGNRLTRTERPGGRLIGMHPPVVPEPPYFRRWRGQAEPEPRYGPAWVRWKHANNPWMTLADVAREARTFREAEKMGGNQ